MKNILLIFLLSVFVLPMAFAEGGEHVNGGRFLKRIEDNYKNRNRGIRNGKAYGMWNFDSKTEIEKLFFGDCNAMVEFFLSPPFSGATGFRIVKDSTDTFYVIELKYISNFKEVRDQVEKMFPTIGIPARLCDSLPADIEKLIGDNNIAMYPLQQKERLKLYKAATLSFPVSNPFAERLYKKMVSAIDGFKVKGRPDGILDGTRVTFRCVVDEERLWTLTIHEPQGDIREFSDLCQQIISDLQSGAFDETKYIKLLK